ncbi:MAG: peptide chain release factor N(5)-glutamine methyltransferase [Candidatus Nanopelagicaceae bacterium]
MLKERLNAARKQFKDLDIPASDAEHIAAFILGTERMQLHAREFEFDLDQEREFEELMQQRLKGIPLQYITGNAPFRHLVFDVGPGVLIPRPETELLVDAALVEIERIQSDSNWSRQPTSVVDLGAGSGAIAISIVHESKLRRMPVQVVAVENSPDALIWLKRNIAKHEVDVRVIESRVETALQGVKCDLVVANPPYIPNELQTDLPIELSFEPSSSLYGGKAGLDSPFAFIEAAGRILKSGAMFLMEHHETQFEGLAQKMNYDFSDLQSYEDLNQRPRWISARNLVRVDSNG